MINEEKPGAYDDIIGLSRPVSKKHPPMDMLSRAAQFSPFAALTGYEELIGEAARFVESKPVLDESEKERINACLNEISAEAAREPCVVLSYFVADPYKEGGSCEIVSGPIKKADAQEGVLLLKTGERIPFGDILSIDLVKE